MKINQNNEHLPQESEKESIKVTYDKNFKLSDTLSGKENYELLYNELTTLLIQKKFDKINEYARNNEWLRASIHEAGHVLMGRLFNQPIVEVKIGNNEVMKMGLSGTATGTTNRGFDVKLNSQQFFQVSLAGGATEIILGIPSKDVYSHSEGDLIDILGLCPCVQLLYDNFYKPIGFNEKGYFTYNKSEKANVEKIQDGIIDLTKKEIPNVLEALKKNRSDLYKLGIELFGRKTLNQEDINYILGE